MAAHRAAACGRRWIMPSDPLPSNQGHIPIPKEFPFTHLSGIWAYVFGPDHRRSRILALFEFWSRRQPKECGVVSIPASYGWISDNLDGEYSWTANTRRTRSPRQWSISRQPGLSLDQ